MHTATWLALQDELEKIGGIGSHAAEVAGLGILAGPSAAHLMGKNVSEKNKSRAEVAGLGVLAAPSVMHLAKKGLKKLKGVMPKHASTKEAVSKEWISKAVSGSKAGKTRIQSFAQNNRHKAFSLASSGSEKSFKNADKRLHAAHEATKQAAPTMGAMMNMHRLADAAKAAKPVASAVAGAGKALTNPNSMGRAAHLAANVAQGGHAWNPAAAAKRAISL